MDKLPGKERTLSEDELQQKADQWEKKLKALEEHFRIDDENRDYEFPQLTEGLSELDHPDNPFNIRPEERELIIELLGFFRQDTQTIPVQNSEIATTKDRPMSDLATSAKGYFEQSAIRVFKDGKALLMTVAAESYPDNPPEDHISFEFLSTTHAQKLLESQAELMKTINAAVENIKARIQKLASK